MSHSPASTVDPRPEPPERPSPEECCQSGCNPCVFDLYQEALEDYRARLRAWEARHAAKSGSAADKRRR